jgi:TetR/AcrR family transcriptional repressor of mexJK operon
MARPQGTLDKAKRKAILQAARQAFLDQGYGASMDDIAASAGVSKQTVYSHFGSKGELLRAIVTDRVQEITAPLVDLAPDATLRDTLGAFGRSFLGRILAPQSVALQRLIIAQATEFPELARIYYEAGPRTNASRLATYLASEAEKGAILIEDATVAAELFLGLLLSHMQLRANLGIVYPSESEIAARVERVVAVFLAAHAAGQRAK